MSNAIKAPSREQLAVCDAVESGKNVTVTAVAGAGKSTTCFIIAQRLRDKYVQAGHPDRGKSVMLCFNNSLQKDSERRVHALGFDSFLDTFTVHGLGSRLFGRTMPDTASLQKAVALYLHKPDTREGVATTEYDLCFIDEAQDLSEDMVHMLRVLQMQNKFPGMQFVVVGDPRQEIYSFSRSNSVDLLGDPASWLPSTAHTWRSLSLRLSYRLTPAICRFVNTHLGGTILPGNTGNPDRKPRFVIGNAASGHLVDLVLRLVQEFTVSELMILVPSVHDPACRNLRLQLAATHNCPVFCTAQGTAGADYEGLVKNKVVFSSLHQSKGLERRCVLVFGIGGRYEEKWQKEPNPLYVALTRAREQLVIFQQSDEPSLSPFEDVDALEETAEIERLSPQLAGGRAPKRACRTVRTLRADKVVQFVPDTFLRALVHLIKVSKPQSLGEPAPPAPTQLVNGEFLPDIFKPAIIAAFQHTRTHDKPTLLERLATSKELHTLPRFCQSAVARIQDSGPADVADWLTLGLVHVSLATNNVHVPHQVKNMSWVTEKDRAFFRQCVGNLLALTGRHELFDFDKEFQRTTPPPEAVTVKTTVPYVSRDRADAPVTAWVFTMDDFVLESHMWEAAMIMWTLQIKSVLLFFITRNEIVQLKTDNFKAFDAKIAQLINKKAANE